MAEETKKPEAKSEKARIVAKKPHTLTQNGFHRVIKKGDDVSDVPTHLLVALKTEGVVD